MSEPTGDPTEQEHDGQPDPETRPDPAPTTPEGPGGEGDGADGAPGDVDR